MAPAAAVSSRVRAAIPGRRPDTTYNLAAAPAAEMMKSFFLPK